MNVFLHLISASFMKFPNVLEFFHMQLFYDVSNQ